MATIRQQLVTSTSKTYSGTNPDTYITIHETANQSPGAGAAAHANLQSRGNVRSASWHYSVDELAIVQSFRDNQRCWHAGDGRGNGNMSSIAIEICVNSDGDFTGAVGNAASLVQTLMARHGIPASRVVQHNHWSGKNCPTFLRTGSRGITWANFIGMASGATPVSHPVTPPPTPAAVGLNTSGHPTAQVQAALNRFGYGLAVDGIYGTRTTSAARDFQRVHGLATDGIVGPLTWGALSKAPTTATISKTALVVDGIWGYRTTQAEQKALRVTADGIRGPITIAAEQRRTGARVDGIDGPDTRTHLQAHLRVRQDGIIGPITVRALQTRLNAGTF